MENSVLMQPATLVVRVVDAFKFVDPEAPVTVPCFTGMHEG